MLNVPAGLVPPSSGPSDISGPGSELRTHSAHSRVIAFLTAVSCIQIGLYGAGGGRNSGGGKQDNPCT